MREWIRPAALLAALLFLTTAHASRTVKVYDVTLRGTDAASLEEAMRIVLVRATGQREARSDPALAPLVGSARSYLASSRTTPAGTEFIFNGAALDAAIQASGHALWTRDRPFTLVVLDAGAGAVSADARTAIDEAAVARGLPVSIVPKASLNLGPEGEASREWLLPAVQRLGADAVLIGRGDGGAGSLWQWSLTAPDVAESWSGPPAAGIHGATDAFVRVAGPASAAVAASGGAAAGGLAGAAPVVGEGDVVIAITGVRDLRGYAQVTQALSQVPGVRRVGLEQANEDYAVFRVTGRVNADTVVSALTALGRFELSPSVGSGERTLAFRP